MTRFGERRYRYDDAGRVVSDGLREISWDGKGRLAQVIKGDVTERYTYAGDSRAIKETTENGKTKRVRYIAADVEERDGALIRYVTIGNRALKLDRDSSVPVQDAASSPGLSAGALVLEPISPLPPAAWALGLFLLLASWLRSQFRSAARMLRPGLMVAAASLLLVSCGGAGGLGAGYAHSGNVIDSWPDEAELTLADHLGSGVAVADKSGEAIFQRSFHPYGSVRSEKVATTAPAETQGQAYGYVDNERDTGTGLGHFHARPYGYQSARFLGPDPLRPIIEGVGDYPDGTELELEIVANDEMSANELLRLNASIDRGIAECEAGLAVPAEVVLEEMRSRLR